MKKKETLFNKIKNYSDVCKELNENEISENDFLSFLQQDRKKLLAFAKLQQIKRLFNNDWIEDWKDSKQYKYYPYFNITAQGWSLCDSGCHFGRSYGVVCVYKDRETSDFIGKTFLNIYKDLYDERESIMEINTNNTLNNSKLIFY